ncbi:MAG: RNA-binding protein [Patescibacteria group bacterium]
MAKRLYIGGIPYRTTEAAMKSAFEQVGPVVSATIITDKMTGRSRGFGFVEMENDEDIARAIEMWNGKDFEGRRLTVNEARPMEERAPRRESNNRAW